MGYLHDKQIYSAGKLKKSVEKVLEFGMLLDALLHCQSVIQGEIDEGQGSMWHERMRENIKSGTHVMECEGTFKKIQGIANVLEALSHKPILEMDVDAPEPFRPFSDLPFVAHNHDQLRTIIQDNKDNLDSFLNRGYLIQNQIKKRLDDELKDDKPYNWMVYFLKPKLETLGIQIESIPVAKKKKKAWITSDWRMGTQKLKVNLFILSCKYGTGQEGVARWKNLFSDILWAGYLALLDKFEDLHVGSEEERFLKRVGFVESERHLAELENGETFTDKDLEIINEELGNLVRNGLLKENVSPPRAPQFTPPGPRLPIQATPERALVNNRLYLTPTPGVLGINEGGNRVVLGNDSSGEGQGSDGGEDMDYDHRQRGRNCRQRLNDG